MPAPKPPSDRSLRRESELAVARAAAERSARREKLAVSGGQLLSAAFQFLGELFPAQSGFLGIEGGDDCFGSNFETDPHRPRGTGRSRPSTPDPRAARRDCSRWAR